MGDRSAFGLVHVDLVPRSGSLGNLYLRKRLAALGFSISIYQSSLHVFDARIDARIDARTVAFDTANFPALEREGDITTSRFQEANHKTMGDSAAVLPDGHGPLGSK
jgi:hypothetical protein